MGQSAHNGVCEVCELRAQLEDAHKAQRQAENDLSQYMAWYAMADHERQVAESFHKVAVKERDYERAENARLRAEVERLRSNLVALEDEKNTYIDYVGNALGQGEDESLWDAAQRVLSGRDRLRVERDELSEQLTEAWIERDALQADAERYREWRRAFREGECSLWNALCEANSDADHDAAIDAARESAP